MKLKLLKCIPKKILHMGRFPISHYKPTNSYDFPIQNEKIKEKKKRETPKQQKSPTNSHKLFFYFSFFFAFTFSFLYL